MYARIFPMHSSSLSPPDVHPEWVVSDVFDWEELPEQLAARHTKPVFVRDLPEPAIGDPGRTP